MMYNNKINLIYRKEMVSELKVGSSKSPNKPEYLLDFLTRNKLDSNSQEEEVFEADDSVDLENETNPSSPI